MFTLALTCCLLYGIYTKLSKFQQTFPPVSPIQVKTEYYPHVVNHSRSKKTHKKKMKTKPIYNSQTLEIYLFLFWMSHSALIMYTKIALSTVRVTILKCWVIYWYINIIIWHQISSDILCTVIWHYKFYLFQVHYIIKCYFLAVLLLDSIYPVIITTLMIVYQKPLV